MKNVVKVLSKSNQQKTLFKLVFCWHFEGQLLKLQDPDPHPDPDTSVRGMDPRMKIRIRIHTKMSWIRNSGIKILAIFFFRYLHMMEMSCVVPPLVWCAGEGAELPFVVCHTASKLRLPLASRHS